MMAWHPSRPDQVEVLLCNQDGQFADLTVGLDDTVRTMLRNALDPGCGAEELRLVNITINMLDGGPQVPSMDVLRPRATKAMKAMKATPVAPRNNF